MKTLMLIYFTALFSLHVYSQNYVWTQKANFPGNARYEAVGFSIGTKGYFGTGANFVLSSQPYNDFWEWDQSTNVWTQKANVPGSPRYGAASFAIDGKGYVTTGFSVINGGALNDLLEYDPATNTWVQKANFPGSARYDATGIAVGGYGYLGFGYSPLKNDFWRYDPSINQWSQKATLPSSARQSLSAFVVYDLIYIVGGFGPSGALSDVWEYNPSTNGWTQKASYMMGTCYSTIAFQIPDFGFVGTGTINASQTLNTFFCFNPLTNSWSQIANLPASGRFAGDGFSIGNYGYTGLGRYHTNVYYNDLWEYGPSFTSISETTPPLTFSAYPNPATDVINITLNGHWKNNANVSLTDMAGKKVLQQLLTTQKEIQLNVSALPSGHYVLLVTAENGNVAAQQKVVVE